MDWFRNVPNVIRNQSNNQLEMGKRESSPYETNESYHAERKAECVATPATTFSQRYSQSQNHRKQDELICALCGETYVDPRLLPCLHTFCRRCLEHTVNPRSTILICHLCRKETNLKLNGVLDFPQNFVINNILDTEAVRNSATKPMLCNSCNEQLPATARCLDCMDFLCYACHNAHGRVRITKDHQILTLDQLKRCDDITALLHRPVFCTTHSQEKVTYFCKTCQQNICRECVITSHNQNSHDYNLIEKAIESQKDDVITLKQVIEQKLPLLKSAAADLNETQKKLDTRSDYIRSEIKDITPKLMQTIEEKEAKLLKELSMIVNEKKNVLIRQSDQLNSELKNLDNLNLFTEQVLLTGTNAEILSLKSALCNKLRELAKVQHSLEPEADDQISCDTNIVSITSAVKHFARFSIKGEEFLKCVILGDISTAIKGQMSQLTLVIKNQFDAETGCRKEDIESELQTPDLGVLVPELREKTPSTYTLSFRTYTLGVHKLSIKLKKQNIPGSPFSVDIINNNISDTTESLLKETSSGKENTPTQSTLRALAYSQPLSLEIEEYKTPHQNYTDEELYYNQQQRQKPYDTNENIEAVYPKKPAEKATESPAYLRKFSQQNKTAQQNELVNLQLNKRGCNGKLVYAVGNRGTSNGEFHGVFGVASDHVNKRIIATDCHNHRVQVFDEDKDFLFMFGKKGSADGEFQNPTGVGVGPNGEIVVCERLKGRIQVFDSKGVFQRRFILNEMKASTLCVDISGRIIIADYSNCCIFILDPILERWSKFGHFGQAVGELQYPCYVVTDLKGNVFVSDMNSNKIQMFDSEGMFMRSFGSKGDKEGEFLHPTGIAIDIKGRLIVADRDNHRIQIMHPSGEFHCMFGSKGDRQGDLNDTHGLCVLSNGNIAAADLKNNRVQVFSLV